MTPGQAAAYNGAVRGKRDRQRGRQVGNLGRLEKGFKKA